MLSAGEVIFTRSGQQSNSMTWLEAELVIENITTDFRIAFEARSYGGYYNYRGGDIAVDDVLVQGRPLLVANSKVSAVIE